MKIKRIYVEAKRSSNYNSYTVGFDAEIEELNAEYYEILVKELQTKARKLCNEQIAIDKLK